jgi:ketosteroid isomerase-like protein
MRKTHLLLSLIVGLVVAAAGARADDAATIAAINASSAALDDAFERQDEAKIRSLMTPDHVAVTAYYGKPVGVAEEMQMLSELKFSQTIVSKVGVTLLGSDAAIRTFIADIKGSFKGKPFAPLVFVTATLVRRDGQWLERQYQTTPLKP